MKIIYVNCGVKNEMKDDHRSYIRCLYNCNDHPSFNSSDQMCKGTVKRGTKNVQLYLNLTLIAAKQVQ